MRKYPHLLHISLINSFIYYTNLPNSNISTVEYVSSNCTALIDNDCTGKKPRKTFGISNQKKKISIEKSISGTENSGEPQLLAHTPEVISISCRCAY